MLQRFSTFENILFSDQAKFHLNGHVNRQNCRYWANENTRQKHSQKVIVWAAISSESIIGPYFLEDFLIFFIKFTNIPYPFWTPNSERWGKTAHSFLCMVFILTFKIF